MKYLVVIVLCLTAGCQTIKTRSHDREYDPVTGAIIKDEGLDLTYQNTTSLWDTAKTATPVIGGILNALMPGSSAVIQLILGALAGAGVTAPVVGVGAWAARAKVHRTADLNWDESENRTLRLMTPPPTPGA